MNTPLPSNPASTPSAVDLERLNWAQTRALIRSDFARLVEWYGGIGSWLHRVGWFIQPNFQCLFLYRLSRYLYLKNWRSSARLLATFSVYVTGCEISPRTSIGPACLIAHAFGVVLFGKLGARLSIFGQGGTGGGLGEKDIGGGPGYPVVGDDVVFGIRAIALGPIHIGNRVKLGPTSFLKSDAPDDALIVAMSSKVVVRQTDAVAASPVSANP